MELPSTLVHMSILIMERLRFIWSKDGGFGWQIRMYVVILENNMYVFILYMSFQKMFWIPCLQGPILGNLEMIPCFLHEMF